MSKIIWHKAIGGGRFVYGTRADGERVKMAELGCGLVVVATLDAEALPVRGTERTHATLQDAVDAEGLV